jgi:Fur family ferric uptake transcriptional regulator
VKHPAAADLRELLMRRELRPTAARQAVLARLVGSSRPVAPSQLCGEDLGRRFDRVTIYRTLAALKRAGLVHAVRGTDGAWRYRGQATPPGEGGCPGNHPHFLCLHCGHMQCLSGQRLPHIQVSPGVRVQGKQLLVYGLCAACVRRTGQRSPPTPGISPTPAKA